MYHRILPTALLTICLFGCGAADTGQTAGTAAGGTQTVDIGTAPGGGTNVFNPYTRDRLPSMRATPAEHEQMLKQMGSHAQRIEREVAHRPHWREELYPVVFGDAKASHEILVLLDFSSPQSEKVWQSVLEVSRSLKPAQAKIVVFANSRENYGTDLMGLGIWISYSRQGQAMPYLSYALSRWNAVKAEQKKRGGVVNFKNEYDATVNQTDIPIHYEYMAKLSPAVPSSEESALSRYCYDAGNANMFQAVQISGYYKVGALPAVIADGKVVSPVSAGSIMNALK